MCAWLSAAVERLENYLASSSRARAGRTLNQAVIEHVASRRVLLLLDNAEHLLGACVETVDALLRQGSQSVVMVSSREALGIAGELTYRVPSRRADAARRSSRARAPHRCRTCRIERRCGIRTRVEPGPRDDARAGGRPGDERKLIGRFFGSVHARWRSALAAAMAN